MESYSAYCLVPGRVCSARRLHDLSLSPRDLVVHSFLLLNSIRWCDDSHCVWTIGRHLGCFWGLGFMDRAAMNSLLFQAVCGQMLSFLSGTHPRIGIAGSLGNTRVVGFVVSLL